MKIILVKQVHGTQMADIIDVSELDCIFLTYDEPRADDFYSKIRSQVPWVKRVHGVKGSDAAHKAAAAASDTERFILIDGDNLPFYEFFNEQLRLTEANKNCVFRWRAVNWINGLSYGNGGISSWTKDFVNNMRTHEATDGTDETVVEFCFDKRYWAMHNVYSETHPNGSQYHAWRAGFREGVKLCLDQGRRLTPEEFESAWRGNRHNLEIWCTVGRDIEHGDWAIYGARMGAYMAMFDDTWNYTEVRDFDKLETLYQTILQSELEKNSNYYAGILTNRLGLNIIDLSAEQSAWYKKHRAPHVNVDIMLPERDFQRVVNDAAKSLW
jgi:hypothetical protein